MPRNRIHKQEGFTLIEILVVVAIIGFLAAVVLLQLQDARLKARNTKRIADKSQVVKALNTYAIDYGILPNQTGQFGCLGPQGEQCFSGFAAIDSIFANNLSRYLPTLPAVDAPVGMAAHNRIVYYDQGDDTSIIWFYEGILTAELCPGTFYNYYPDQFDLCVESVGPNEPDT